MSYISPPIQSKATIIDVTGMPWLEPVTEDNKINANTIPDAPNSLTFGNKKLFVKPVTTAVAIMT